MTRPTEAPGWQCRLCGRNNAAGVKTCKCGVVHTAPNRASEAPPAHSEAVPRVQSHTGAERGLQHACEALLRTRGIEFLHLSPRAREKAGWPDLTFAVAGKPYAVELKREGGTVSEAQLACLARLAANGWHTAVIRSADEFRLLVDGRPLAHGSKATDWTGFYPTQEG